MSTKAERQKKLHKEFVEDKKMVRGVFNFNEVRGGSMSFVYKKYKDEPVKKYDMVDGQVYTIPLGVAKHLNKNGWYPIHSYSMNDEGKPATKVGEKVRRFGFQGLDFGVSEDFGIDKSDNLVTVETIR